MDPSQNLDAFGWVGATIEGKYRVDAVVGEGGFGIVYRGHHLGFEERVALKCLRMPETLIGEDRDRFFASFLSEGRLLHRLSRATAGIVQALDVGGAVSPKGIWTPYLVLEWLEGRTLDEELDEHAAKGLGGRTLAAAIELLEPAARALAVAHEQGIAHRDVKPANLFVAEVGGKRTLKVLDFGIAKVITETASLTRAFEATGSSLQAFTARYGAPEQFSRRFGATGPWTDVFALALVFVEIVTGRSALDGEDAAQLFVASSDNLHRPTLRSLGVPTSDALEAVLRLALAVDPKERYLNAGDFWDALVAAATADGVIEAQPRRRAASILNITSSAPDLDATAIEAASIRRAEGNAATQLATTSAVPLGRKPKTYTAFRPTALRVSGAAGAATLV